MRRRSSNICQAALLSSLPRRSKVFAVFEERNGFGSDVANYLVAELYQRLDWVAYELPQINLHYPMIQTSIGTKADPGLQAADFLLWATLQKLTNPNLPKARWHNRIKTRSTAHSPDIGEGNSYGQIWAANCSTKLAQGGRGVYESPVISQPLPHVPPMALYRTVELAVREASARTFPAHAQHLQSFVNGTVRALARGPNREQIKDVARAFLRLFDTLPLHMGPIAPGFDQLYDAKRLAALMIRDAKSGEQDLLESIRTGRHEAALHFEQTDF